MNVNQGIHNTMLQINIQRNKERIRMLEIYVDAASAGNPGPSAIGVYIKGEGHQLKIGEYIGISNNHVAEFIALIRGLQQAQKLGSSIVSVRSDSKIVVSAVEKQYVKNEDYQPLLQQALALTQQFELFFIKWIPDTQNKAADALARQAIQQQRSDK